MNSLEAIPALQIHSCHVPLHDAGTNLWCFSNSIDHSSKPNGHCSRMSRWYCLLYRISMSGRTRESLEIKKGYQTQGLNSLCMHEFLLFFMVENQMRSLRRWFFSDIPWGHLKTSTSRELFSSCRGEFWRPGHPQNPQEAILSVYLAAVNFRNGRRCIYKADTSDHLQ